MHIEEFGKSITFHLKNIAFSRFTHDSMYENIISPFTRLYLITEGNGYICSDGIKTDLNPDHIYLISSFTPCSYFFEENLAHYYIHCNMELPSGLNIQNLFSIEHKIKAIYDDYVLFQKCLHLNPGYELPHHDPKVYQSKPWINKEIHYHSLSHYLETKAILMQIFSRFVGNEKTESINKISHHSFQNILHYIQENITQDIPVTRLAEMAYTSKDHFTRTFKSIIGIPPSEYIIRKRLEKAKLLLLTSDASLSEIISRTGFHTTSYFCRIFKKYTSFTPAQFRKNRG